MKRASNEAGLIDFGNDTIFVEDLDRWLAAVEVEAALTPAGAVAIEQNAVRLLVNRLRIQADLDRHPEIAAEDVSDPIVVVGLPRTGTTKLHRLLSADPGAQKLPLWRLLNPGRPDVAEGEPDPRIGIAEQYLALTAQTPEIRAAHPIGVDDADEEAVMLEMTFRSLLCAMRVRVPSYLLWLRQVPQLPNYRYLRTLLQALQWQDGGRRHRHWVLKTPYHLGNLDALLNVFPGATVVHCHRDPVAAVPSACRLVEVYRALTAARVDPVELGSEMLGHLAGEMAKNLVWREQTGSGAPVVDVTFDEVTAGPLAVVRRVYERRGGLSSEVETAMAGWDETHPGPRPGEHAYSLERYGLTERAIGDAFDPYLRRQHDLVDRGRPVGAS